MNKSSSKQVQDNDLSNNAEYWQNYAIDLYQMGKIADSIKALRMAEKLNPEDSLITHQIGFLYYKNNDFKKALLYADKALEISSLLNGNADRSLLAFKAMIYEKSNKDMALDIYLNIIGEFENDPDAYDRCSSLVIDKFMFSDDLTELNLKNSDYHKATMLLRNGDLENALKCYKAAIKNDKYCYPAYIGIAQTLYELMFDTKYIAESSKTKGIDDIFINYKDLNSTEKGIINSSIALFERFIPELKKKEATFVLAPIDVRLTDYPENQYLKGKKYYKDVPFCHLRGIGGDNAFVGIERLRDFLWEVPDELFLQTGCVAHEFAHLVWCLLSKKVQSEVKKLYSEALQKDNFVSNYSKYNPEEYFAEYSVFFSKNYDNDSIKFNNDPMVQLIKDITKA